MDPDAISKALDRTANGVKAHLESPDDFHSRVEAQIATKKLLRELQNGDDFWWDMQITTTAVYALRFLSGIGAFQKMPKDGGSISAADLAKLCETDLPLIIRPMRLVAAIGGVKEVSPDVYQHNRQSMAYGDSEYWPMFEVALDDFTTGTLGRLHEYYAGHPKVEPQSAKKTPYAWAFGMEGSDWINVVARTHENIIKFSHAFSGKWAENRNNMMGIYPFETLVEESTVAAAESRVFMVDIGGNNGSAMKEILEQYPDLKGRIVVQDREDVISHIPAGFLPQQVETMVHDFWTPQPIKNASVYYIKRVLHDWPDHDCVTILSHIAAAMSRNSRLLISENIIPESVGEDGVVYSMDVLMMTFAGKERSVADWKSLFNQSGLQLVKIHVGRVGNTGVIETRIK